MSPTRKNLAQYLEGLIPDRSRSDNHYGVMWGITLRSFPGSPDRCGCGVALRIDGPGAPDLLFRFVDLAPLANLYSAASVRSWQDLISSAKQSLELGREDSPSPDMLLYDRPLPWQHPDPLLVLQRFWDTHVNFFQPPAERATLAGGTREMEPTSLRDAVAELRAAVRSRFDQATIIEDGNSTTLVEGNRVTTLVQIEDMSEATEKRIKLAATNLRILADNRHAALFVISPAQQELLQRADRLMRQVGPALSISADTTTAEDAPEMIARFFAN